MRHRAFSRRTYRTCSAASSKRVTRGSGRDDDDGGREDEKDGVADDELQVSWEPQPVDVLSGRWLAWEP